MAQYRGLKAIAERLGCSEHTVVRKIANDGLLAYKVRTGRGWEVLWVTDDDLIQLWQIAKCHLSAEHLRKGSKRWHGNRTKDLNKCPQPKKGMTVHDSSQQPSPGLPVDNPT